LLNVDPGAERKVVEELKNIPNVTTAYPVYGVYDLVAIVEAKTTEQLKYTITYEIRKLGKIRSTLSMIVVE